MLGSLVKISDYGCIVNRVTTAMFFRLNCLLLRRLSWGRGFESCNADSSVIFIDNKTIQKVVWVFAMFRIIMGCGDDENWPCCLTMTLSCLKFVNSYFKSIFLNFFWTFFLSMQFLYITSSLTLGRTSSNWYIPPNDHAKMLVDNKFIASHVMEIESCAVC